MGWETEIADVDAGETIESAWGNAVRDRLVHGPTSFASLPTDAAAGALAWTTDVGLCIKIGPGSDDWRSIGWGGKVLDLGGTQIGPYAPTTQIPDTSGFSYGVDGGNEPNTGDGDTFATATTWTVPDHLDGADLAVSVRGAVAEYDSPQTGDTTLTLFVAVNGSQHLPAATGHKVAGGGGVHVYGERVVTVAAGDELAVALQHIFYADTIGQATFVDMTVRTLLPALT